MKLSQEVLTALSGAEVSGNTLRLVGQLDRKLYTKVNDALVALGGSWNKKAKAHLFEGDAADRIGTIERLPSGSFKASGTNVETVLVTMTKGAA